MDGRGDLLASQLWNLEPHFDVRALSLPTDDLTPWSQMVERTIELIQLACRQRPVYLCGESFGACLALLVVAKVPKLIHRLVVINPASSFQRLPWLQWIPKAIHWLSPAAYQASTLGLLPLLASDRVSRRNREALLSAMRSVSQESVAWRLSLLSHFQVKKLPLNRFDRPSLIVAGGADRLLPSVEEAEQLAQQLPAANIHQLPFSGHACLLEDGVNLYQILQANGWTSSPRRSHPPARIFPIDGRS